MIIGICLLDIHISQSQSLKNKRMVIKAIKDSLKKRFNISIAEVEFQDLWQRSKLAVVAVSNQKKVVERIFSSILQLIESNGNCELNHIETEFIY
jgi:uncharacterized protein YlxP (DUF503 family)